MICVSLLGLLTCINYLMRLKKEPGTELIDRSVYTGGIGKIVNKHRPYLGRAILIAVLLLHFHGERYIHYFVGSFKTYPPKCLP